MDGRGGAALRSLFTFPGGTGHFLPMVPVARAAAAAGHVVAFACQAAMVATVEATGFPAFDAGGSSLLAPGVRQPLLRPDAEADDRAARAAKGVVRDRERASAVLVLGHEWQPDVLVCDESDFGAVVAAERLGLPHATVQPTAAGSVLPSGVVAEQANELRAEHGLPADPGLEMLHRYLVLVPFPPSFRDPGIPLPPTAHALRHVSADLPLAGSALPWLAALSGRETVYVTLGTIFNQESGDLFERIVRGVRDLPVNVVATVGRELDPEVLGPQPPDVHVERYIPQAQLWPRCSLVVSHGGSGSVIGALAHGLPMVVVPIGADQPRNARRCTELGFARVVHALEATPDLVREAASDVLAEPTYRLNAERMQAEIAALPGPDHAVTLLEHLATDREPLLSG
jgi:UDP:flavonoid glycosyltransferase YjiC (YdhE family)